MYLETIYVLSQKSSSVRAIGVGESMGASKPFVSRAIGLLKNDGLVVTDELGFLKLTQAGEKCVKQIYERHTLLTELFTRLGVDEKTAQDDAAGSSII